jgi:AcrR family transcriptional regulator
MKDTDKTKEQLILQAAETEFMLKGFQGAKTTSIAKAAGVTHAMLHYYYRTKENLFNKVFEAKMVLISDIIIQSVTNADLPLLEKLKLVIESHFNFLANNPDLPRFLINELISQPDKKKIFEDKVQVITQVVVPTLQKELDNEAAKGNIEKITAFDLMLNIISLNVFVFITFPILKSLDFSPHTAEEFLENRKRENVEVIMRRLIKQK